MGDPAAPQPAQPVLSYADRPARMRITYAVGDGRASFIIPAPPWYGRPELVVPLVLFLINFLGYLPGSRPRGPMSFVMALALVAVIIGAVMYTIRFRRPTIIELTDDSLRLENIRGAISEDPPIPHTVIVPRKDIYDLKFVSHSGNLFIRAHGREMIEFRPINDRETVRWIANELREVLGLEQSRADAGA